MSGNVNHIMLLKLVERLMKQDLINAYMNAYTSGSYSHEGAVSKACEILTELGIEYTVTLEAKTLPVPDYNQNSYPKFTERFARISVTLETKTTPGIDIQTRETFHCLLGCPDNADS
ncbi:hypothetical protein [Achromobacter phage Motura]|uniref:Uncharacterized protein n=1 Tax=Achromobacter phage Motura TaxID=2591403 RepID=A0A514CTA5_9CAUD|nr:hypothetical protein H1O15_gp108 [Achromobacter phage Motura]QDH83719.1 hypothetical protein [Achromobacter phage Motura]